MMDQILPELIPLICDCMEKRDLLSMALSMHAFVEPALDALWREVNSLTPLICCLPADLMEATVGEYGTTHYLRRELMPQDLRKYLMVYAPRIRSVAPMSSTTLSTEVLRSLSMATQFVHGALSPNAEAFYWDVGALSGRFGPHSVDLATSYISLFAGNLLSKLYILNPPDFDGYVWDIELPPLFRTAMFLTVERLPNLRNLELDLAESPSATPAITRLLTSYPWDSLQYLHTRSLSKSSLHAVVLMLRLVELRLWNSAAHLPLRYDANQPPTHPPSTFFPSLKTLVVNVTLLSTVISLIQHLPPQNRLESLIVVACSDRPASLEDAQNFFATMGHHFNPCTFYSLSFALSTYNNISEPIEVDVDGLVDISPLFSFPGLRWITISSIYPCHLAPPQIAELIRCLPLLERLAIHGEPELTTRQPLIGFEHVLQLAQGLPALRDRGLRFDATRVRGDELAAGAPFHNLQSLNVDSSPILSPSKVIHSLRTNFPQLHKITRRYWVEPKIIGDRWDVVAQGVF